MQKAMNGSLFLAYWPLTFYVSKQVRPISVGIWTAFYYFGIYRPAQTVQLKMFQSNLNTSARNFAEKYGIKTLDSYTQQ